MSEAPVLSNEEVEALLKAGQGQEKTVDLSSLGSNAPAGEDISQNAAFVNVMDGVRLEWEKGLSAFLRKKVNITVKAAMTAQAAVILEPNEQKYVYNIFQLKPNQQYGAAIMSFPLLHNTITLLYGGKISPQATPAESVGKVGVIVAEKLSNLLLTSFSQACVEYGALNFEMIKSTPHVNLLTSINPDDEVYAVECSVVIDESEGTFKFFIMTDFLTAFFPQRKPGRHKEKDFWRSAINTQVSDSQVNVNVTLADISMKMHEVLALKEGDTIPINDPTLVYICLNNLKLFRASAGQSNNKLVAKIISQI